MKSTRRLAGLTSEKPLTPSIVCPKRLSNARHVYRLVLMPPTQLIARANRFWLIGIDSFVSNDPLRASGQSVRMLAWLIFRAIRGDDWPPREQGVAWKDYISGNGSGGVPRATLLDTIQLFCHNLPQMSVPSWHTTIRTRKWR